MTIRRLPQVLVDQIAAGEVIERPASVVKELVENSVDAGSSRIDVKIEGAGQRRILIQDNGRGIPADQLPLALESHATSKIQDAKDLLAVNSFGFRGEALASIASISHLKLTSRPADATMGASLVCRGGEVQDCRPESRAPGTTVDVRDLFFNTPARRKFLKADATETGHVLETILRIALTRTDIGFFLETGGRKSLKLEAGTSLRERIADGYGKKLAASLLEVNAGFSGMRLKGFIAPPDEARARTQLQHLYINDRFVRDRTVQGAARRAYHDFLAESLRPIYFLFLDVDPREVDCNVHPTKTEVRLRNSSDVFRLVVSTIEKTLQNADLAPRFRHSLTRVPGAPAATQVAEGTFAPVPAPVAPLPPPAASAQPALFAPPANASSSSSPPPSVPPVARVPGADLRMIPGRYVQVLNTYLVTATEEGLLLLDQHALHERVLYRHLRREWNGKAVRRQDLLTPIRVELKAADVLHLEESSELLESVGVRLSPFSATEVAVSSVPAVVGMSKVPGLISRLAEFVAGERPEGRADDFADRMLFTMACHRAVRAGDPLNEEQVQGLLHEAEKIEHSHTCPHGRPTRVVIPVAELENMFKRRGF